MNIEHEILRFDIRPESGYIINSRNVFRWYEDAARDVRPLCCSVPMPVYDAKRPEVFDEERFGEIVSDIARHLYLKFPYHSASYFCTLVACIVRDVIANNGEQTVPISNLVYFATPKRIIIEGLVDWYFDFPEMEPYLLLGRSFYAAWLLQSSGTFYIKVGPRFSVLDSKFNLIENNVH